MKIVNLTFSYGDRLVFQNANVSFSPGPNLIMGPSGCGKTTLLKVIGGILKPDSSASVVGKDKCLLVLQEDALLPWQSGYDNIAFFLKKSGAPIDDIEGMPLFSLVSDFVRQPAWQMSYGQRRTIELFRALAANFDVLCLDEPLNFIDMDRRKQVASEIIASRRAKYTIVSTHEPADFAPTIQSAQFFDGRFPVTSLQRKAI